jgi:hypothetical protein
VGPFQTEEFVCDKGSKIIKSNVIDDIMLLLGASFFPKEVLLSMA